MHFSIEHPLRYALWIHVGQKLNSLNAYLNAPSFIVRAIITGLRKVWLSGIFNGISSLPYPPEEIILMVR